MGVTVQTQVDGRDQYVLAVMRDLAVAAMARIPEGTAMQTWPQHMPNPTQLAQYGYDLFHAMLHEKTRERVELPPPGTRVVVDGPFGPLKGK